jgi:hypothetical protein
MTEIIFCSKCNQHCENDDVCKYNQGYAEAIDMVIDVIGEMYNSYDFHNPTLDELEQRIV